MNTREALEKLCKWRTVLAGWHTGTRSMQAEGVKAMRDLADVRLLLRAEASALAALLIDKGVFTAEEFTEALGIEASLLDAQMAAKFPGFRTSEEGVVIYDARLAEQTMSRLGFPP